MVNVKPAAGGYLAIERMAIHAAMIEGIDCSLGKTIAALTKADKLENTLLLVLSDNGASSQMLFDKGRKVPDDLPLTGTFPPLRRRHRAVISQTRPELRGCQHKRFLSVSS